MKKIATIIMSMIATCAVAETQMQIFNEGTSQTTSVVKDSKSFSDFSKMDSIIFDHYVSMKFDGNDCVISNPYDSVEITNENNIISIDSKITRHRVKYVISGKSDNASIKINAANKQTIVLNGVNLTSNGENAPINITSGKTTKIIIADGTENSLTNSANDTVGAVIRSKGQIEFTQENGGLVINAVSGHGIQSSDYVEVSNGEISIMSKGDGIHVNDYYEQNGGNVTINAESDGIDIGQGYAVISNGNLSILSSGEGTKGIKSEIDIDKNKGTGDVTINGGNIDIRMDGKGSRGIKADGNVMIDGGNILVYMKGESLEEVNDITNTCGIKSSKNITVEGGKLAVICDTLAKSSRCVQADLNVSFNGGQTTIHQNAKGKADVSVAVEDLVKRPRGVQADGDISINTIKSKFYIRVPENAGWGEYKDGVYVELKVKPFKSDGNLKLNNSLFDGTIEEFYEELELRTPEDWEYSEIDKEKVN